MKKSTYIFIAFLLNSGYIRFGFIASIIPYDVWAVIIWLWGFIGLFRYSSKTVEKLIWQKSRIFLIVFYLGIILSLISSYINHEQNPFRVLISLRPLYYILYFFVWIKIQPKEFEIIDAIRKVVYFVILFGYLSLIFPTFLITPAYIKEFYKSDQNFTHILMFTPGLISFGLFYFYYLLYKSRFKITIEDVAVFLLLLILLFINQNRSTLIGMAIAMFYIFFTLKGKKSLRLFIALIILVFVSYNYVERIIISLFEQSQIQLTDPNYNRNAAVDYFLFKYNHGNIWQILFGNGQPSYGSYLKDIEFAWTNIGADLSDIGLLGDWFKFGIIPVISIIFILVTGLFSKKVPLYMKFIIIHILVVPTIYSFSSWTGSFMFSIYLYLIILKKYGHINNNRKLQYKTSNPKLPEQYIRTY